MEDKPLEWPTAICRPAERIAATLQRLKSAGATWRLPILVIALAIFVVGTILSLRELNLRWNEINAGPLLVLALLTSPLTIAYSVLNMMLMGKAVGIRIDAVTGAKISVFAQVAELLPIPGGAIVRTAALVKGGGGAWRSTGIVLSSSVLWIACAAIGGGYALAKLSPAGMLLFAVGFTVAIAITLWIGVKYGWTVAVAATVLRVLGLALVAFRMILAFATINMTLTWDLSLSFAFAVILGSAASIVPAGLGVGESLSALIAVPAGITPAAAFLASALGRLIGFGGNMLLAGIFIWKSPSTRPETIDA